MARARLLATIAVESRGTLPARAEDGPHDHAFRAARQAESLARRSGDAPALAFALNGVFMQSFHRAGLAPRRDALGAELVTLCARGGLETHEVLGHLIRVQARCAVADFAGADRHAAAADRLAARHELPLVATFARWYAALRTANTAPLPAAETAYEEAAALLDGAGMPGLEHGLLPLARLSLRIRHHLAPEQEEKTDWGPYEPWVRPLLLLDQGRRAEAREALHQAPAPPRDLLFEALWCLLAKAATALGERPLMTEAHTQLAPAAEEIAGAGSGLLSLGPVAAWLDTLRTALADTPV